MDSPFMLWTQIPQPQANGFQFIAEFLQRRGEARPSTVQLVSHCRCWPHVEVFEFTGNDSIYDEEVQPRDSPQSIPLWRDSDPLWLWRR
jgi:hypothetical protein